jgi:hypothetical protein
MWVGHIARTGKLRNAYTVLGGNPEGKRKRGRLKKRLEDDIRKD